MRMTSARIGKNAAPLRLLAILVFLPLSATLCHAQCFDGASGGGVYAIISPSHFAPGQSYNASVTVPSGGFNPDTECPTPAVLYIVNAASYGQGVYYQEDPFVTVSNLAYVSTTEITFTVTVASNAPTESDAWSDISGDGAGGAGGSVWLVSNLEAVSITPCALAVTPTITSIQPAAFFAGESTTVTITGTGFMPTTNANSCAPTTPSITAGSENVALSNVNVVSPTEITLAATPQGSDPLEAASVTAANYSLNGPPYFLNSNAEPADILPVPTIQWNNNIISGAKAQNAVVGQPINLTTTPTAVSLAAMFPFWQSTWEVAGTNIAGYTPSTDPTVSPASTVLTNTTLSTYWIYGGTGLKTTYNYCVNAPVLMCSPNASATFNVAGQGQGSAKVSVTDYGATKNKNGKLNNAATIDYLYVPPACTSASTLPFLDYGSVSGPGPECPGIPTGAPGITFTASGASSNGTYSYVQTITTDSRIYTLASGNCTATLKQSPALDSSYPYEDGNFAIDGPEIELPLPYTSASRNFVAKMYLMWTSTSVANPIPVPLGYQQWQFQAKTTNPGAPTTLSWTTPTVQAHGAVGTFAQASPSSTDYGYPTWGGLATETGVCTN